MISTLATKRDWSPEIDMAGQWHGLWIAGLGSITYSDGNEAPTWYDISGNGRNLTNTANQQMWYNSSVGVMGNAPAMQFFNEADVMWSGSVFTLNSSVTAVSIVIVTYFTSVSNMRVLTLGGTSWQAINSTMNYIYGSNNGYVTPQGGQPSIVNNLRVIAYVARTDGTARLYYNTTAYTCSNNTINTTNAQFNLNGLQASTGYFGMAGIFNGDITTDSQWTTFRTWASERYS